MRNNEFTRILASLKQGESVEFQGMTLIPTGEPLTAGSDYYAARNTGQFFTAKEVDEENGWVVPTSDGYLFDIHECVSVRLAE